MPIKLYKILITLTLQIILIKMLYMLLFFVDFFNQKSFVTSKGFYEITLFIIKTLCKKNKNIICLSYYLFYKRFD